MKTKIMVAGVGNVFMNDDGFGCAVIKSLQARAHGDRVVLRDFGTGGLKLAYDLMQGFDALILVDAVRRGGAPGTLYLIEPCRDEISMGQSEGGPMDPHGADVSSILRVMKSFDAWPPKTLILGCEPAADGIPADDNSALEMGLSEPVRLAVDRAAAWVEELIKEIECVH